MLVLRAQLEIKYGYFSEHWGLSALFFAIVFFGIAYLYDHKGVLIMATGALTLWVGLKVDPSATILFTNGNNLELLPLFSIYAVIALVIVYLLHINNTKINFTVPYLYFYSNLLLSCALIGYLNFEFHSGYFLLLFGSVLAFSWVSFTLRHAMILIFSIFYFYIAITTYFLTEADFSVEGNMIYLIMSSLCLIVFLFKVRNYYRGLNVPK